MSALVLHHAPGACSRVPLVLLQAARADFRLQLVQLKSGQQHQPAFQALNPKGKVPVLVHGEQVLTENLAISTWIARRYPDAQLMPRLEDDWSHAQALSWLSFCAATLHPLIFRARLPARVVGDGPAQEIVRQLALAELCHQLQVAEQSLSQQTWLVADRWMAPDIYLFWCTGRSGEAGVDLHPFPALTAHHKRLSSDPVVSAALERESQV
jgi:glutathione S-transferase